MKNSIIRLIIVFACLVFGSCGLFDKTDSFKMEFTDSSQFLEWLTNNGHKANLLGKDDNLEQLLNFHRAIDGSLFIIDDEEYQCFIFDYKGDWEQFLLRVQLIFKNAGLEFRDEMVKTYYNARCYNVNSYSRAQPLPAATTPAKPD